MPSNHNFIGVEIDGLHRKCDICSKKVCRVKFHSFLCLSTINGMMQIWVLKSKVQECQNCGLKCHKKCTEYCMKQVPCYKKNIMDLQQWLEGDFAIYEHSEEIGTGNGHRLLDQQTIACKVIWLNCDCTEYENFVAQV